MKKSIVIFLILGSILTQSAPAQLKGRLTGRVLDADTRAPLYGANILVNGTVLGTAADAKGYFTISNLSPGSYSLTVSMMGYRTQRVGPLPVNPGETVTREIVLTSTPVEMDPVIITAGKHAQALSSVHQAVATVTPQEINRRQARTLQETLTPLPGIHFNERNISIRGSSGYSVFNVGSRVLLMIDGVPYLTSDLGAINWEMVSLLDIDRIEVVKGAGSALYGSSAMGGVVNIITRAPSKTGKLRFRAQGGAFDKPHYKEWRWTDRFLGFHRADIDYSRQLGPVGFRLSLSRFQSTGYMENNQMDQWNAAGRFNIDFRDRSRLNLFVSWMKNIEGGFIQWINQNSPFEVPPYNKDDEINFSTLGMYIQYHKPFSSRFGMKFRLSHLMSEMGNQLTADDPGAFKPGQGTGAEIQADWLPLKHHHLILGSEYRLDVSGSEYFEDHEGYSLSAYLQDEWQIHARVTVNAGLRLDKHILDGEEVDSRISPKFGCNFTPRQGTNLRFSAGRGFRAATVFERYIHADYSGFNVIANPDLEAEYSDFWEVGLRQQVAGQIKLEVAWFQSDYWNMIEPVIDFRGTIQFQNYVRARIRGLELMAESWWFGRLLGVVGSLTWLDPKDLKRDMELPYRPKVYGNVRGIVNVGPASLESEYRYAQKIDGVMLNPLDPRVPVKLLAFRLSWTWKGHMAMLAINNALNYHYAQIERRMGEVRSATLGIQLNFGQ